MRPIEANFENTWPEGLLRGLEAHRDALSAFQLERAHIDAAAYEDVMLRINRPSNPHQAAWDEALALAEQTTASGHLLGFHATRLMKHEVEEIKRSGLQPLSVELLQRRLGAAQKAGALTAEEYRRLFACHQAACENRLGRMAFCFTHAQLKDEGGVGRLLGSWGGEALYNSHEDDAKTGPLLKGLGSPCIVVAAVGVADIDTHIEVGERLVNCWCARRAIVTEHRPEFEGKVRTNIPGENILRIVRLGDPEFLALTEHNRWRNPLS